MRYVLWDDHCTRQITETDDEAEAYQWLAGIEALPRECSLLIEDTEDGLWYHRARDLANGTGTAEPCA